MKVFQYILIILSITLVATKALAEDINLNLNVQAKDDYVRVAVENRSLSKVRISKVVLEFNNKQYLQENAEIRSYSTKAFEFFIQYPQLRGSYPLKTEVFYYNDGIEVSMVDVGYYNYQTESKLALECPERNLYVRDKATLALPASPVDMAVVMPSALKLLSVDKQMINFENANKDFSIDGKYYFVYESVANNLHQTKVCNNQLLTFKSNKKFSFFSDKQLFAVMFLALFSLTFFAKYTQNYNKFLISRSAFSVLMYTWFYLFMRNAGEMADYLLNSLSPPYTSLKLALISQYKFLYFQGGDYDNFFQYLADYLLLYFIFVNYFVLKHILKLNFENDKYFHLQGYLLSKLSFFYLPYDKAKAKIAFLALLVKAFYVPLFTSWLIAKVFNLQADVQRVFWDIGSISSLLISIFIFIDVLIFCFGYLVESSRLKNVIRSVEPTFFGWFVCLICYPPFNQFMFYFVDKPLDLGYLSVESIHIISRSETVNAIITIATTLLWFVYVWASVALGYKGSNLTNRGIVSSGPYRYFRHPAYVSKVSVWVLSAVYFGKMNIALVLTLLIIYGLRAWTEERHLSADPEYLDYKKKVPWMFFPRVF